MCRHSLTVWHVCTLPTTLTRIKCSFTSLQYTTYNAQVFINPLTCMSPPAKLTAVQVLLRSSLRYIIYNVQPLINPLTCIFPPAKLTVHHVLFYVPPVHHLQCIDTNQPFNTSRLLVSVLVHELLLTDKLPNIFKRVTSSRSSGRTLEINYILWYTLMISQTLNVIQLFHSSCKDKT